MSFIFIDKSFAQYIDSFCIQTNSNFKISIVIFAIIKYTIPN